MHGLRDVSKRRQHVRRDPRVRFVPEGIQVRHEMYVLPTAPQRAMRIAACASAIACLPPTSLTEYNSYLGSRFALSASLALLCWLFSVATSPQAIYMAVANRMRRCLRTANLQKFTRGSAMRASPSHSTLRARQDIQRARECLRHRWRLRLSSSLSSSPWRGSCVRPPHFVSLSAASAVSIRSARQGPPELALPAQS